MPPQPRETWHLDTAHIGRRVLFFDHLESTNTTAAELAAFHPPPAAALRLAATSPSRGEVGEMTSPLEGEVGPRSVPGGGGVAQPNHDHDSNGLVVIADYQTSGRGQYGRVWQARPGSSLLMSVALRPPPDLCRPVILTAFTAVAVAEAIFALTGVQARVKWPNDLLIRGKKVCGILIESAAATVIGIGLNLTQTEEEFARAELPDATSLGIVSGGSFDVATAANAVIRKLDAEYARLLAGERVAVEADWKWRIGLLGRQVAMELTDGTTVTGRLHEMSFDGLELETGDCGFRTIVPETVRHITAS